MLSVGRLESKSHRPLNKCLFDIFLLEIPPELMVGVDKVISYFLIMQGSRASPKDHSKLELLEGAGSVHGLPLVLK